MLKTSESRPEEHDDIFHIINPHSIDWNTLSKCLKETGLSFDIVPFEDWIKKVKQQGPSNPAYKFADFIEKNFMGTEVQNVTFETIQTAIIAPILLNTPKVDAALLDKFSSTLERNKFFLKRNYLLKIKNS
ncbi:uncharacterized protein B0P05DRAFT_588366 [Gilbertella persicaria]|uniref:uncharacterized protein n=1 Tax=Gilbertella persicaria TaxID=101096 RepID=UPI002220CBBC|nr:uncharacterized protein B0P05DRAFT_588366 [Gilbertella persicaria]KAI8075948.1 hypothetical protein B0P05DRAFT_588366 [Gilbertella persicaria]